MRSTTGWRRSASGAWAALAMALLAAAGAARAERDVLERPAMSSAKAASAVLLAVTSAGPRLVAAGERGIIVLSDDNGLHWRQAKVPVSVSLTNLRFVSATKGWAVGHSGVVLGSSDGGETWSRQLDGRRAARLALDAAADGKARAEAERVVAEGPDKPFFDVYFSDENKGLIVGAFGLAFSTHDGGKSWQPAMQRFDNPKGKHLYSIFVDGADFFVVGEQGAVFCSTDGGNSFAEIKSPYEGSYFGVLTAGPGAPLVFGLRGKAFWSGDGGLSWAASDTGTPNTFTAGLRRADGALVLADETGRVLVSRDGGRSFKPIQVAHPSPYTGLAQARDGSLILSGMRGITRVSNNSNAEEAKK